MLSWFARNGVCANLLMLLIAVAGLVTLSEVKQEVFPEISTDKILVNVVYPGAAPAEVEKGVCMRIEEAVDGVAGIKRLNATASEGAGTATIDALPGTDIKTLLEEVKMRVDAITTFPEECEKPLVQELILRRRVLEVAVHGEVEYSSLRKAAEKVRDGLSSIDGVSLVQLTNARPYEISIELSETALRRHQLNFDQVAAAVRRSSLDLPGGSIKTGDGEILLRTRGQSFSGSEFENITILTKPDGTRVRVGDVCAVQDGFADTDQETFFDGKPAIMVSVFRVGDQNATDIAEKISDYIETEAAGLKLPDGLNLTIWQDDSKVLRGRLDLLIRNGRAGLILVFLSLALFLRLRLAFWVALGIPVCFLGAIALMPLFGMSINVVSLFAFIVVLGIVVDDAIIVGESIYRFEHSGRARLDASIEGARQVARPVIFAILTTVAAFFPLLTVPGSLGRIMAVIPTIVISVLIFSLIESLLILPNHLSHGRQKKKKRRANALTAAWSAVQGAVERGLAFVIDRFYSPLLDFCLRWRYLSVAASLAIILATSGLFMGGWIQFHFMPKVDADNAVAFVSMPQGTPAEITSRAIRKLEASARKLEAELRAEGHSEGKGVFRHICSSLGGLPFREAQGNRGGRSGGFSGSHLCEVNIELAPAEERTVSSNEIARRWRELTGPIADANEVTYTASFFSTGDAVNVDLASSDPEALNAAAARLRAELGKLKAVHDITDSFRPGKRELQLRIREDAEHLGLSQADLGRQVRQGFYGLEAQRILRGRDEIRVMIRYPKAERRSLGDIENMRVRTRDGSEVPFTSVANIEYGRGFASINRADRRRIVTVKADVDKSASSSNAISSLVEEKIMPGILADFPGVRYSMEGERRERMESLAGLKKGFILALFMIFILLAIAFKSYLQPLIIMSVIPLGLVAAIWGHIFMGMDMTIFSMFGLVALTGVLVNDSLVMVDFINTSRKAGAGLFETIVEAGKVRFRPILLTSLTTFAGLTPLLLERSIQARFLIPMAVSLGFGVLFATAISLVMVPVGYLILEDVQALKRKFFLWWRKEVGREGPKMGWFIKAITRNYANFSGRAQRAEYWWFMLCSGIICGLTSLADVARLNAASEAGEMPGTPLFTIIFCLAILLPGLGVQARRLHDIGKSGALWFLILIPCFGALILLVWALEDSQPGNNQYGSNPKEIGAPGSDAGTATAGNEE